jgi:hypothetical protein
MLFLQNHRQLFLKDNTKKTLITHRLHTNFLIWSETHRVYI